MSRPVLWMLLALVVASPIAYLVYRLARGLGFLEPPIDKQHEHRRTIIIALYAFLLFLPVLIYGFEKGWPRAWILFGIVNGLVLLFFAASGVWAARQLWRLRHPDAMPSPAESPPEARLEDLVTGHRDEPFVELETRSEDQSRSSG